MKRFACAGFLAAILIVAIPGSVIAAGGMRIADKGLVPYTVVNEEIPVSLTGKPGDPIAGKKIAFGRKLGNCLACHSMPFKDAVDPGNVGPDLAGIGSYSSAGHLRLRLVNPKLLNPATIMPAYYRVANLHRVSPAFVGKPMLDAQQIEDVVAFLMTIK